MSPAPIPENEQDDPDKNQDGHLDVESMETPQFNIAAGSSSDTDEDDPGNHGYELLPQDAEMGDPSVEEEDRSAMPDSVRMAERVVAGSMEVESTGSMSDFQVPPLPHTEATERRELWSQPRTASPDIKAPMDQAQADRIKAMMAGFNLPACHQPSWAKHIPEDQWKTQLLGKLNTPSPAQQNSKKTHEQSKMDTESGSTSETKETDTECKDGSR